MLSWYIQDTRALLRDTLGLFTPTSQLTRWINEARRQAAQRSGCIRCLVPGQAPFGSGAQPGTAVPGGLVPGFLPGTNTNTLQTGNPPTNTFNTIPGQELYPYAFANPYLQAGYAGVSKVIDIVSLAVSWGGIRPNMSWLPWEDLQAYARSYNIGVTSYPFYWSTYNDGELGAVYLFPVPTNALEMEWDCFCVPNNLNTDDDFDAIPPGFRNSIKYYAASLAFMGGYRYGNADIMESKFMESLMSARASAERGRTPDYYWFQNLPG